MTCKNCGAKLDSRSTVCSNCGAGIENESNYVLMTENDSEYNYRSYKQKKNNKGIKAIIALILIAVTVLGGEYYYFNIYEKKNQQPQLAFSCGAGVINGDEQVIYVSLPEDSKIEYINGVSVFDYDLTAENENKKAVSTDYEYTKSINGVFRTIFFDLSELNVEKGKDYTYSFKMIFSFYGDDKQYSYIQPVTFNSSTDENISSIVFDHSMKTEETTEETTTERQTTTQKPTETSSAINIDSSFLYTNYWYSEPYSDDSTYAIEAYKFASNGNCTITSYTKKGNDPWIVKNINTTFSVKGDVLSIKNDGEYIISSDKTISGMTERKFNSEKNAEDFFGI